MKLGVDGRTCVRNERVLLFSRPNEIRGVDLDNPYYHIIPPISLPLVLHAVQLDFYGPERRIYWADSQINEIKRVALSGVPIETLIDTAIEAPNGVAVDWLTRNIFYSSHGAANSNNNNHIAVCNLNGEYVSRIVTAVSHVKSLAVDPPRGRLFWSDVGGSDAVIYASRMDGSQRSALVTKLDYADLDSPASLSYDVAGDFTRFHSINRLNCRIELGSTRSSLSFVVG